MQKSVAPPPIHPIVFKMLGKIKMALAIDTYAHSKPVILPNAAL
jgi:hypothetical protein